MRWKSIVRLKSIVVVLALAAMVAISVGYAAAGGIHPKTHNIVAVTDTGPIVGLSTDTMNEFLGIPYAAPPVGDLRWRPPQRATRWHGTREATEFANHCPQPASPFGLPSVTEDCLYLNVYTPAEHRGWHKGHGYPVMVWFHGGAGFLGESDDYDPSKLVENEDVIVVTINYRLGFLGFLAHPALSAETKYGGSGDYGFMDQQAALKWVQRNIKNFGGDPNNVTIFGESFGGLSVHTQLASPEARGLFDGAIVESGAYFLNTTPLANAEAVGTQVATFLLNCPGQDAATAACLRSLPVTTLLQFQGSAGFTGNVDNKVLTQPIGMALLTGEFNQVPVMEGSNHDEWRLFVALNFEFPTLVATDNSNYVARISASFGGALPASLVQLIANFVYPTANYPSPSIALGAVGTDGIFACNSRLAIREMANFVPVFAYEFNDQNAPELFLPPNFVSGMPYGAAHASEIQYIFDLPQSALNPLNADQERLSDTMVSYWGHFARNADPNSRHTPDWPQYDPTKDQFQSLIPPQPMTEPPFGFTGDHKCSAFWTQGM